jgi:hypothetical protein
MLLKWGADLERRVPRAFAVAAGAGAVAAAVGLSGLGFAADPPRAEGPKELTVQVAVEPGEGDEVRVVALADDEKAAKSEELKAIRAKIEKAIKDGKVDEAKALLDKLEQAVAPPPPTKPARPARVVPPFPGAPALQPVPAVPARIGQPAAPPPPPVVVQAPRGDWAVPAQVNNWGGGPDLRKQYEKQLKDFDRAIQEAKDDDAREQLAKARDEYKKAMEEAVKKADVAKEDLDKARKELNRAAEQNRLQLDMGQKQLLEMHKRLEERLMKQLPQEFERLGLQFPKELERMQQFQFQPFQPGQFGGVFNGNEFQPFGQFQPGQPFGAAGGRQPRFGATVEKIPPAMVEQLNLDKDTGILIVGVVPGTVADKLGLKKNDVLLRFAGKDIPSDPESFVTMVGNVKGGQKIDVTVLRKGKEETFKDVVLPEAKQPEARGFGPAFGGGLAVGDGGGFGQMSIMINDGDVTISASKDGVKYAITGRFEGGKLATDKITVTEGKESDTFDDLKEVPEKHRGEVEKLIGRIRGVR